MKRSEYHWTLKKSKRTVSRIIRKRTEQNRTKQKKTKQNKTKQNKTKNDTKIVHVSSIWYKK